MKKLFTLILCWLLAFEAFGATTFKAKTAASVAGGYVTSLNKVDGSFEDGASAWSASVGTIVPTASTEFQGNFKGVWAGIGTGTLDLQWTATASNTYEASAQVNVNGEDDVYVCAYVGTEETGCKLIPALTKIQKVSAVADSVLSSAFYLRLKHTGSDAFSVDVDDGKIEPWTPQAVNLVEQESWTISQVQNTFASLADEIAFDTDAIVTKDGAASSFANFLASNGIVKGNNDLAGGIDTRFYVNKTAKVVVVASIAVATVGDYARIKNSSGVVIEVGNHVSTVNHRSIVSATLHLQAGDYFSIDTQLGASNTTDVAYVTITATAISENITQLWNPSDRIGETIYLPQNVAPKGFISAMGSSIGKTSGTYQGDTYYNLYKVLWNVALNTADQPYYLSAVKGTDALTDWNAGKTITIDESGLFTRAYKSGVTNGVGQKQDDAFQGHWHELFVPTAATGASQRIYPSTTSSGRIASGTVENPIADGTNGTPRTAAETRPVNVAKYVFIRYATSEPTVLALPTSKDNNKTYTEAQTGSITGSSGAWTTLSVKFFPYRTISKTTNLPVWRMAFTLAGSVPSASRGNYTLTIPGVLFPSNYNIPLSGISNSYMQAETYALAGTNTILINHQLVTTARYEVNGDVELASKPTWADEWVEPSAYIGEVAKNQVAIVSDVKTSGVHGGASVSGAFYTRDLNTVDGDTSIVSVSGNQFTLQAGEYDIEWTSPFHKSNMVQTRLYNVYDSQAVAYSANTNSGSEVNTECTSIGKTKISLTAAKTFSIQYRTYSSFATTGLGGATSFGTIEKYTQVKITKLNGSN